MPVVCWSLTPWMLFCVSAHTHTLQVELLLTMEEFCAEEGVFEPPEQQQSSQQQQQRSSSGAAFAPLFPNLLQRLYDAELVEEAAITAWAEEKQHADEDEKVFLNKVSERLCVFTCVHLKQSSKEVGGQSDKGSMVTAACRRGLVGW